MTEQSEFEEWAKEFYRAKDMPFKLNGVEYIMPEYQASWEGWQACAERKDKHKQEILGALLIGLDAAKEIAANYKATNRHLYRENESKMLDDDVVLIERAITLLAGGSE